MQKEKHNAHPDIDWDALDKSWADQYEEDYSDMFFNSIRTHIHTPSHLEESMVSSV